MFVRAGKDFVQRHSRNCNAFMFMKATWSPHAPPRPGAGGLYFGPKLWPGETWLDREDHSAVQTVFVCKAPPFWLYMGEYEVLSEPRHLSVAQWRSLGPEVGNVSVQSKVKCSSHCSISSAVNSGLTGL